ncbi:hypothetical protein MJD09_16955 [bacterium]|nr:hypothetical protein [bacterium]
MSTFASLSSSRFSLVLLATALLSYSVLTFEIALTRIFSVMLSYHYVFAVLSFALLGLGLGGILMKSWSRLIPRTSYYTNAALAAIMMVGSEMAITKLPLHVLTGSGTLSFWIYIIFATIPFVFAGLTLAGLFQEFAQRSSVLYGADLLGATLGALLAVRLLDGPGAINAAFVAALAAAACALILSLVRFKMKSLGSPGVAAISVLSVMVGWQVFDSKVPIVSNPDKDMYRMLTNPQDNAQIVESRWSAFGRTDLVRSTLPPDDMTIYVDGSAGSPMYNFNSITNDPEQRAYLTSSFGAYFPFHFLTKEEKESALIIGSGGGREVVMALLGGVEDITAVEVNPDVVQMVRDYRNFNGGIYNNHPKVRTVVAEGRNYIRSHERKYDLIILAIPVTKSSRSVEGYALTENFMFTVESMQEYLDRLTF